MSPLAFALDLLLSIFYFIVLARVVIGFIEFVVRDWSPRGFVAVICELVFSVTDPPMRFISKYVPPVRIGAVALDLSPLILLLGIVFLRFLVVAFL
ncbi:MAG: YggT family protein [Actinomycetales bacterium]|nr:YggT family protein [Actinomycetales bacterium]